jgi:hypothetical protein
MFRLLPGRETLDPPIEVTRPEWVRFRNSYTLSPPVCGKEGTKKIVLRKIIRNFLIECLVRLSKIHELSDVLNFRLFCRLG